MQKPFIYMDNAATTPLRTEALEAMLPFLSEHYGNPSAIYGAARTARKAVEEARGQVASLISAQASEIVFCGSGTEANNWALRGVRGKHIITQVTEHHATTHVCKYLEKNGTEITYLPVNKKGFVSADDLRAAIKPETALVSIMWANNEIGTIQPIAELAEIAKENGVLFHTDAVQAAGHLPVSMAEVPVDLLTMSAHKFGGPKGVGALYIRKGTKISPFIYGGAQEKNRRAGTENVAGIIGMGAAAVHTVAERESEHKRLTAMRDNLINRIEKEIADISLNGPRGGNRLPNNINFSFDYIEGESLLLLLDMNRICASSGSACSSASLKPSHVVMALGVPHEKAHGSIRFSLGRNSSNDDIDGLMAVLPKLINQLRAMSPLAK